MKTHYAFGGLVLLIFAAAAIGLWRWKRDEPKRVAIHTLQDFTTALLTGKRDTLLQGVIMPAAIQGRTAPEQTELLTKALREELSHEGLTVLQRDGAFGTLANIFPAEAQTWATQAGVRPEDCIAFKLERNGLRAEVVLACDSALPAPRFPLKIVRLNNVKQLAQP